MHKSGAPYRRCPIKTGYSFGYDHVFGNVRGLHCTWLIPRTRASSDGVDVSDSAQVWPNRSMWTLYHTLRWDSVTLNHKNVQTHVDSLSVRAHIFHIMFSPEINSGQTEAQPEPVVKRGRGRVVGVCVRKKVLFIEGY
ncbi:hypothetical protein M9H77_07849 [Catharanthus roseus]|uniref:Uncharacterized protein n=1 Tax=Catharanthus roseus TaxID=4058 RepID=A0ACC0BWA9_CATRO|nr:hypothetical protein M9H77_07849 [Catharanthus roseus]